MSATNLLVGSWELSFLSRSDQFGVLARAYLDSAQRLCRILERSPRKISYARGAVVLYLAIHACELFLKGAIVAKNPKEKLKSHDLGALKRRYDRLYPSKRFGWDLPFRGKHSGLTAAQEAEIKRSERSAHAVYRYPVDPAGEPWRGVMGFAPVSFLETLLQLGDDMQRLHALFSPAIQRLEQTTGRRARACSGRRSRAAAEPPRRWTADGGAR